MLPGSAAARSPGSVQAKGDRAGAPPVFLSLVIPAYIEERRLPETLQAIEGYLARQPFSAEVIVVENGSTDRTAEVIREFARRFPNIRFLTAERKGKGLAVKTGMLAARGVYRFLCDADLSMPIEELANFLPPLLGNYGVAIGSREAPGARRYGEPPHRHAMGRIFNWLVRLLAVSGLQDTQAGFKCFTAQAAEDVFRCQTVEGFGFDVEVLFIARKRGYRIVEVPIQWHYKAESRVRVVRDTWHMFRDVLVVRWNDFRARYGS